MPDDEYKVWNLLDEDQRRDAVRHVEEQVGETKRGLNLVKQADRALAEIQRLLEAMKEVAKQAVPPGADRQALGRRFESLRMRIDLVETQYHAALSPEDKEYIRKLLSDLEKTRL